MIIAGQKGVIWGTDFCRYFSSLLEGLNFYNEYVLLLKIYF